MAIAGGLYISGIWRIDRLEAPHLQMRGLGVMLPPPAPSGGLEAARTPPIKRKKKPPVIVQLEKQKPQDPQPELDDKSNVGPVSGPEDDDSDDPTAPCDKDCGEPQRAAPVCGDSSRDAGEQCDDGNTINGDGCSSTCRIEVAAPKPAIVPPTVLSGLRISGETQVHPSAVTQNAMIRADVSNLRAVFLVCVATDGGVAQASLRVATNYPEYDAALQAAVERWRYRPYTVRGAPVPACSTVEFHYTMR